MTRRLGITRRQAIAVLAVACCCIAGSQPRAQSDDLAGFDQVLDTNVRDGYVYYRTLKANRAPLDRFVAALPGAALPEARDAQIAFWLNAYNALVLRAVIDRYPIATRTASYPRGSIKQIAGVFERTPHVVAGKSVTLDQIEQRMLPPFRDPRVFLALGRGAAGGGRLRSEVYTAAALAHQLDEQASECVRRDQCVHVDEKTNTLQLSAIFTWRSKEFVDAYSGESVAAFAARSPIERALLGFISPRVLSSDRDVLARNQFKVQYLPFDWSLNDLATRKH